MYDVERSDLITLDGRLVVLSSMPEDEINMLRRQAEKFPNYERIFEQEAFAQYAQISVELKRAIARMDEGFFMIINGQKVTKISYNLVVSEFISYERLHFGI